MISISAAVYIIVYLVVAGLIFAILWWVLNYIALPQPFDKAARVALVLLAALILIGLLLSFVGGYPLLKP